MGLFEKFKDGLSKTRDFFTEQFSSLQASLGIFNEEDLDELEMIMIASDMGASTTDKLMDNLRKQMKAKSKQSSDFVLKTLKNDIREILGDKKELKLAEDRLNILIMAGVNGSGKTTSAAKLANQYKKQGKKVLLCAADTFRAAAVEQLETWAESTGIAIVSQKSSNDPAAVVYDAIHSAQAKNYDVLIIDTAGRLHNQKNLMEELAKISRIVDREAPEAKVETLLVLDATNGQNAVIQTQTFTEKINVTGIILTKLDGSAKGGIAVAVSDLAKTPIYYVGLGEGVDDLVEFDPELFVDSLLPDELINKQAEHNKA